MSTENLATHRGQQFADQIGSARPKEGMKDEIVDIGSVRREKHLQIVEQELNYEKQRRLVSLENLTLVGIGEGA